MTEAEWLAADAPAQLLRELGRAGRSRGRARQRRLRLVAAAFCRMLETHFRDNPVVRAQAELAERMADGRAGPDAVADYRPKGRASDRGPSMTTSLAAWSATAANAATAARLTGEYVQIAHAYLTGGEGWTYDRVWLVQAELIRDIFGNPFRPVSFLPEWRASTAVALAQGIYDDRAFDRLPILADALQDAGCDAADILNHCRDNGPHARGCWVVDAVLGRA